MYLTNLKETGVFNLQGEKIRAYNLRNEKLQGDTIMESEEISPDFMVSRDGNTLFGLISSVSKNGYALGILDYENKILKRHNLKDFEKTQDFNLTYRSGNNMSIKIQTVKIQEHKDKYLISNSIFNTIAIYDPRRDSLTYFSYDSKLTENSKTRKYKNVVETHEEFINEILKLSQEIHFVAPVWDLDNNIFYRFSYKVLPREANEDYNTVEKLDIFMTILDESFNIIGEKKLIN